MSPNNENLQMRGVRLKEILISLEDASNQIKKLENEPKLTNAQKNKRCIEIVQRIYNHGKDYLEEIGFINNYEGRHDMTTKKGDTIQDILALEGTQVALDQLKKDLMAIDDELLAQSKQYSSVLGNMITSNSNRLSEWEAIRINELDKYKHVLDDYTLRVDQKLTEVNEAAIRTMERANRILSGELWKHYLIYLGAGMSALNFLLLIGVLFLR